MKPMLIQTLMRKRELEAEFVNELDELFRDAAVRRNTRKPGQRVGAYMFVVRKSDLLDSWLPKDVAPSFDISKGAEALLGKLRHMLTCGHSNIKDAVALLVRIVDKGVRGVYRGRGDRAGNENPMGHFHWDYMSVTLDDHDLDAIKVFIEPLRKYI